MFFPVPPETVAVRGVNRSAPDLVCGACGVVLATGVLPENLIVAIGCNECGAINAGDDQSAV